LNEKGLRAKKSGSKFKQKGGNGIVCAGEGTRMRDRQQLNIGDDQSELKNDHTQCHTVGVLGLLDEVIQYPLFVVTIV
jgi:hypothetical protein